MSYKEEMREMVKNISTSNNPEHFQKSITDALSTLYTRALVESKKTGQSIESMTYEILEGLEEGLKEQNSAEIEDIFHHAADTITKLIHSCAQESIGKSNKNLQIAAEKLQETIAAEKSHLIESMEVFKSFAADHKYTKLLKKLDATETQIAHLLQTITDKIKKHL